jgi:hypothetical protein
MNRLVIFIAVLIIGVGMHDALYSAAPESARCDRTRVAGIPRTGIEPADVLLPRALPVSLLDDWCLLQATTGNNSPAGESAAMATERMREPGIRFTENRGQLIDTDGRPRPDIAYTADAGGARLYFQPDRVSYVFSRVEENEKEIGEATGMPAVNPDRMEEQLPSRVTVYRMDLHFEGCNTGVRIHATDELPMYRNYYLGHCPDGITHVRNYERIVYENLYNGIDLIFRSELRRMKYEFIVHPDGDPSDIALRYDGAASMSIDSEGNLHIETPLGRIVEQAPVTFQAGSGTVASAFMMEDDAIAFEIGEFNRAKDLIIDPWATYFGGSDADQGRAIIADGSGNVYVTGYTLSTNFPVMNAGQTTIGGATDAFIAKFTSGGSCLWATYYGGSNADSGWYLAIDTGGNIYLAGNTTSGNIPLQNPWQNTCGGGQDVFLLKLDNSGQSLWATYFGGNDYDTCSGIGIGASGSIYLGGFSKSTNLPTTNAYQPANAGDYDFFAAKLTYVAPVTSVLWLTYLGGSGSDNPYGFGIDASENVYLPGGSYSTNFPVLNAYQSSNAGQQDAVLAKLNSSGQLQWSTYFGGSSWNELFRGLVCSNSGYVYVTGQTDSSNFPLLNPCQSTNNGGTDMCIVKFTAAGSLVWSTFYGGSVNDIGMRIALDGSENVYISGTTLSANFPVMNSFQANFGGVEDAAILKITSNCVPVWSTYYGSSGQDQGWGITVSSGGSILATGLTSGGITVVNAWQNTYGGNTDAYILSIDTNGYIPVGLASFTAARDGDRIALKWKTAYETGNQGFFIERSAVKEEQWETRGFMPGSGSASTGHEYSFSDESPAGWPSGMKLHYRLRQIDADGHESFSPVIEVEAAASPKSFEIASVYPNPAGAECEVELTANEDREISLLLFDRLGREACCVRSAAWISAGRNVFHFDLDGIPPGVYFLHVAGSRATAARKLVIRR